MLKHDGVVYHFYCAVGNEGRVIALATSKDLRAASTSSLEPANLRCEMAVDPLGVDVEQPRLSWTVESAARGAAAVGLPDSRRVDAPMRCAKDDGDLWDSGKVASDETLHIPYAGKPLASSQQSVLESPRLGPRRQASAGARRPPGRWAS